MNVADLVGAVVAAILREDLQSESSNAQSTGRFVLNLSRDQVAAVAFAVLADPFLEDKIDLKIQSAFVARFGLPDKALTTFPATY